MKSLALCALAAAGLAATASTSRAAITLTNGQSVNLDTVLASADKTVNIGDKTFVFLSYTTVSLAASQISIVGFIAPNPLQGTGFDLTGPFGDTSPGDTNINEFNIRYTVEVMPSFAALGYRITDSELAFNGNATGAGSYARVDESIFNYNGIPGQNLIVTPRAFIYGSGTPAPVLQDQRIFGPPGFLKLDVNKDVQFFANGVNGSATASFIRQSFSQVPSPAGSALLGLAGLVAARRRRA